MRLTIHTDGGSRGNPGLAGGGVVVLDETGKEIYSNHFPFGVKTNNEAEYLAVLEALKWLAGFVVKQKLSGVNFVLDSKLVVEQLSRRWKIKEARLKTLAEDAWKIIAALPFEITFSHVLRHKNTRADLLANEAMDMG